MDKNDDFIQNVSRRSPLFGQIARLAVDPMLPEVIGAEFDEENMVLCIGAARPDPQKPGEWPEPWNVDYDPGR